MATNPPVPINPQTLDALRARYPQSLETVYSAVAIRDNKATRPGEVPANVFDFDDGLRLIISRDLMSDAKVVLHVSASFPPKCRLADSLRDLSSRRKDGLVIRTFLDEIVPKRFAELSGDKRPLVYTGMSAGGIPHWHIEEK